MGNSTVRSSALMSAAIGPQASGQVVTGPDITPASASR